MNRFIIVDGLPYLYANGNVYSVRWDEEGFTVGEKVEIETVPDVTFNELSIKAKCAACLDSIGATQTETDASGEPEVDIDNMTIADLREYAKAHDIKLNGARSKEDIVKAIKSVKE